MAKIIWCAAGGAQEEVSDFRSIFEAGILDELILNTRAEREIVGLLSSITTRCNNMQLASRVARMSSRASQSAPYILFPPPFRAYTPPSAFQRTDLQNDYSSHRGSRMIAVGHFARPTRANLQILCKPKPKPSRATCTNLLVTAEFPNLLKRLEEPFSEKLEGSSIHQFPTRASNNGRPTRSTTELRPAKCLLD